MPNKIPRDVTEIFILSNLGLAINFFFPVECIPAVVFINIKDVSTGVEMHTSP